MSSATAYPITSTPSCFNKAWNYYQQEKNAPLVASYRALLFNSCILAERIFKDFPPILAYASKTCLSYSGVLALYEYSMIGSLKRSGKYCIKFFRNKIPLGTILTAFKVYFKAVNIILILGGAIVSLAALVGFPLWMNAFYLSMRIFSVSSITLSGVSRFTDLIINRKLVQKTISSPELWTKAQREKWETASLEDKAKISCDELIQFVAFQIILTICAANPGTTLSASLIWGNSIYLVFCAHRKQIAG